jgi:hypothetical protein
VTPALKYTRRRPKQAGFALVAAVAPVAFLALADEPRGDRTTRRPGVAAIDWVARMGHTTLRLSVSR